jgi:hypothetical protein
MGKVFKAVALRNALIGKIVAMMSMFQAILLSADL